MCLRPHGIVFPRAVTVPIPAFSPSSSSAYSPPEAYPTALPHPHQYSPNARTWCSGASRHWTCAVSCRYRRWALMYGVGRRRPAASPCPAHNALLPPLLLLWELRLPPGRGGQGEGVVAQEWVSVVGGHTDARRRVQLMMTRTHASWRRMTWRTNRLSELGLALECVRA
ncbi:hypothetical protein BJV78DRAFT_831028 [Lactifluus subvellereus]|nr:hypothetical protein BJV78DRAFT_831028 [Lactifluus subvellereus]